MTVRVHLSPGVDQVAADNGVGQVVRAMAQHLPQHGVELVGPDEAEVIACHIQQGDLPRVDVLHCHGLYFADIEHAPYHPWHHAANARIAAAARAARAITVPSAWVAEPFKRDMRIAPHVIGHGVDIAAWAPADAHQGYVLWNKNRGADVCDPGPAYALAERGALVVATFAPTGAPGLPTLTVVGAQPHDTMRELVRHAEVYLATTRETFGIGTLEALAAGVPVLGYDYGGTAELVEHQVSGYLVAPGDGDGLLAGLAWLRAHPECRAAARARAAAYPWARAMRQYAALYHQVAAERQRPSRVSVVVTNFNYAPYVGTAVTSALRQADEVVVVDDGSTDDSLDVLRAFGPAIRVVSQPNAGVAAARNTGIAQATGDYLVCLDADDALDPRYVAVCRQALDADHALGVAYTGLGLIGTDGSVTPNAWPPAFDWQAQTTVANPPSNCIPCAAMFRRSLWQRSGGYVQVYAPGEDTEFFTRGLALGFGARRVTDEALFHYRMHEGSASRTKTYRPIDTWHPWMRDGLAPFAAPTPVPVPVRSYADPIVSVVIPVGPGHARYLPAALDSLLGQTLRAWEVVVVNDGAEPLDDALRPYPFARLSMTGRVGSGPAAARNLGLTHARAPLVLFLDADDYLLPTALAELLAAYVASDGRYVYSDWYALRGGELVPHETPAYTQAGWMETGQHAITALIETAHARAVGGFDAAMGGWEDWDFFVKLAIAGVCGQRVARPLLVYRQETGTVRERSLAQKDTLLATLRARYAGYATGDMPMSTCCGGGADALLRAKRALALANGDALAAPTPELAPVGAIQEPAVVRMEFIGTARGAVGYLGRPSGQTYHGGNNPFDKYADVDPRDVAHLESLGVWRVVPGQQLRPAPVAAAPATPPTPAAPTVATAAERPMLDLTDDMASEAQVNQAAAELAKKTRSKRS